MSKNKYSNQSNPYKMRYYYFNPFSKQYYFPEGFHNYPLFANFYKPYKLSAKCIWTLWWNSALFRNLSYTDQSEKILPIKLISKYASTDSILAFNLGTRGIEQKISILSIDTKTNSSFFMKYATSEIACKNVFNEGLVLEQISHLPFVPKLNLCVQEKNNFTLIITSILFGEKTKHQPINDQMLDILYTLSEQQVKSNRKYDSCLLNCFAHGDFCPWNMIIDKGEIKLFDWEMAGQYPIGYDLFTYIFQYEFLVNKIRRFDRILRENSAIIQQYFNHFDIEDWTPYLQGFAKLKQNFEAKKIDSILNESVSIGKQKIMMYNYLENFSREAPLTHYTGKKRGNKF